MISWIIGGMMAFSFVSGAFSGKMGAVSSAALTGGGDAVALAIKLCGALCLWSGVMEIARRSGLTDALARLFRPLTRRLFPGVEQGSPAAGYITMNMAANLLGLGNAATPLGLAAMRELDRRNADPWRASNAMITFVVLNTASLQLIPATNAYLRLAAGSSAPMEILPAVWLASAVSVGASLAAARLPMRRGGREKRRGGRA